MKKIPLHSLVVMVGPSGAGKSTYISQYFHPHEVVSGDAIREELIGDFQRQDINDVVFREVHRRTHLKLSLGERVVVDATNIKRRDRLGIAEIGLSVGVPVFYIVVNRSLEEKLATGGWRLDVEGLIQRHDQIFLDNETDILKGDFVANVIDTRREQFEVVSKLDKSNLLQSIRDQGYRGVMALGDVHGMKESLKNAIDWAVARQLFMVLLGDVVDYGPDSLECVDIAHDLVMRNKAVMVLGNHERKIERWLDQVRKGEVRLKLSDGNRATTTRVEQLGERDRIKFEHKFRALVSASRNHWIIGDTLFTHGGAEPEMFRMNTHRLHGKLESLALFGEVDNKNRFNADGYPNRVYTWCERVPVGRRVVVGHDIRSTGAPLVVHPTDTHGTTVFLDTGSGKGGHLTTAHMIFDDQDRLNVRAFTTH